jgi:hypothetical protein
MSPPLEAAGHLIEVEHFRTRTVAVAQQALDQLPQLLILGLKFRHNLLQHSLQDASQPMTPA